MNIEALFEQYGYWVLFFGLFFEFIALPFPGELTMIYVGYLSSTGVLHAWTAMLIAFTGTISGMGITYIIGKKAGMPFIERFGKWLFLTPVKLSKTRDWFHKYGPWLLFFAYFIPGVRHFTGYLSGILGIPFKRFAAIAYSGAFFWVIFFIGLGNLFGDEWKYLLQLVERYSRNAIILAVIVIVAILLFKIFTRRSQLQKSGKPIK